MWHLEIPFQLQLLLVVVKIIINYNYHHYNFKIQAWVVMLCGVLICIEVLLASVIACYYCHQRL